MSAKTIATINFKGGVGKTTMTWCLGDYIASYHNNNTLVFDLDAQMSLTQAIALNEDDLKDRRYTKWECASRQKEKSIYNAFLDYIQSGGNKLNFSIDYNFIYNISKKYHFVPCHENFYLLDYLLPNEIENFNRRKIQGFMGHLLEEIRLSENVETYNYVLFDCPPSFTLLSNSVLSCCDLILIPVNPDFYAVRGVNILLHIIQILNKNQLFKIPKIAVFMNKAKSYRGGMAKESKRYWDNIEEICSKISDENSMNICCFTDSPVFERMDIKRAVIGRRGLPEQFVPDFQSLWYNIVGFLNE